MVLVNDTKKVLYNYNPPLPLGVFIQHVDGKLYTTDEWTAKGFSNDEANGVAVSAEECKFVVAKEYIMSKVWNTWQYAAIDSLPFISSSADAKNDFDGISNTAILAVFDTYGAAYTCVNYIFPNGKNGYLPALGELDVLGKNYQSVESALNVLGGTLKFYSNGSNDLWSSTQYNDTRGWCIRIPNGNVSEEGKNANIQVLPFCPIR